MISKNRYLIAGLGNPGREYRKNRHNVGFMALDHLAQDLPVEFSKLRMNAFIGDVRKDQKRIFLVKPQTYMNASGRAVHAVLRYFKIPVENLLVIYDDVDLPFETLRVRTGGGAGGQKGVKSIINTLGTQDFPRLRVGIGRPPGRMEVADYVLQDFSQPEEEILDFVLSRAADAVMMFLDQGIQQTMTIFNQTPDLEN
jgi:peptidyl-tRNA hydrolase, PTH1 family